MQEYQPQDTINNRYRVLRKLGAGAMGSVYLCEDSVENDVQVALKILISENLDDQDIWAKGEYEALTHLRHPHLAKVYNFGRIAETEDYFIVSEFIKGTDLFSATEYLNYEEITEILVQICRALEYIHSQGYVHFDIKPDNILVTRFKTIGGDKTSKVQFAVTSPSGPDCEGEPIAKVIDFGLAEKITGSFSFAIKGTLNYLAPEILNGTTPDKRADLYSLGVTMYQVTNRNLPICQELGALDSPSPPQKRSDLFEMHMKKHPDFLREVILKLIEEKPDNRFQSAREVIQYINKNSSYDFETETEETRASYFYSARLVGRKRESNLLRECYENRFPRRRVSVAEEGEPANEARRDADGHSLILISGEMGSGKSRLSQEFQHYLKLNDLAHFVGNCYESNGRAYKPLSEIVRQIVYRLGLDSELCQEFRPEIEKLLPDLRLGGDDDEETEAGGAKVRADKERIYFTERVSQFFIECSRSVPFVLFVNNLHWVDEASLDLLMKFMGRVQSLQSHREGPPILVIGTLRPEEPTLTELTEWLETLRETPQCREILVRRLKPSQVREFLASMLHISDIPDAFVEKLQETTGGNPLFIVETLKALQDEGIIRYAAGEWSIKATRYDRVEIPRSMEGLLAVRLEKMDSFKREILETLSVLGVPSSPRFVQKIARFADRPVLSSMRELEQNGVLSKQFEDGRLLFEIAQHKVREILYDRIEPALLRTYHGEVANALEAAYEGKEDEILEDLAYHYQRSDQVEKAIETTLKTGDWLRGIFANERAHDSYVYVLEQLGGKEEHVERWLQTQEKLADLCVVMGRYEVAATSYAALLGDEVERHLGPEKLIKIHLSRGRIYEIQGDYDAALKCYKDARNYLSSFERDSLAKERTHVFNSIGWVYVCMGKYEKAMTISLEALRVIEQMSESIEHAMVYNTIGSANFYKGNIEKAIEYHRRSLDIREQLERLPDIIGSLNSLGRAYLAGCDYGEAAEYFRRGLETSEALGDPYGKAVTLHNFARLYFAVGMADTGWESLNESLRLSKAYAMRFLNIENYIVRGEALRDRGDYSKAEGDLFRALTAFTKQGNRWGLATLLQQLAALHRISGNLVEAKTAIEEARTYADSLGIFHLQGACLLEGARLERALAEEDSTENALQLVNNAVTLAEQSGNPELQAEAAHEMGETLVQARRLAEATQYYQFAERKCKEVIDNLPERFRECYKPRYTTTPGAWKDSVAMPAEAETSRPMTDSWVVPDQSEPSEPPTSDESLRRVTQLMGTIPASETWKSFVRTLLDELLEFGRADMVCWMTVRGNNVSLEASRTRRGRVLGNKQDLLCLELIEQALKGKQTVYIPDVSASSVVQESLGVVAERLRSIAAVAVSMGSGVRGIVYLINPNLGEPGDQETTAADALLQPFCNLIPLAYAQLSGVTA